jgi:hypothetical protein
MEGNDRNNNLVGRGTNELSSMEVEHAKLVDDLFKMMYEYGIQVREFYDEPRKLNSDVLKEVSDNFKFVAALNKVIRQNIINHGIDEVAASYLKYGQRVRKTLDINVVNLKVQARWTYY